MKKQVSVRMIAAAASVVLSVVSCLPPGYAASTPEDRSATAITQAAAGSHGRRYEDTAIQSKTSPVVVVREKYAVCVAEGIPDARQLVLGISEDSDITAAYAVEPEIPSDYRDLPVTVILRDASGNRIEQECVLSFHGWMKESITIELGQALTPEMLLENPKKDASLLNQTRLDKIPTAVGNYTIKARGRSNAQCSIAVVDTTPPALTLKDVLRWPGQSVKPEDFVDFTDDLSGAPMIRFAGEAPDCRNSLVQTVAIEAEDASGNITTAEAVLRVGNDKNPPQIHGATEELIMEKRNPPDFLAGVYAVDGTDRYPTVTVDTSALNPDKAGTYYITYFGTDHSGNVGTFKRKVTVKPDQEDTNALVQEIAETLPDDPEAIRDYVRDSIAYNHNWGGDDPVWYGLKNKVGNCYVHALTLKAFLDLKGYETQLIWVENKSHYWLIIKLDEGWRHIDATPSPQHMAVSLMTDEDRAAHINGRTWDRSAWPACE